MSARQRITYVVLLSVAAVSVGAFAFFWFSPARLPHNFDGAARVVDVVLFLLLTFVVWHRVLIEAVSWLIIRKLGATRPPPPPRDGLRVAFITTFVPASEPIGMLRRTLSSMLRADYPHDTWVLDEGNDEGAKELCRRLGVQYFTRHGIAEYNGTTGKFAAKTKGGNHNAWYDAYGDLYDIVAQIDTDFVADRKFLTRTLGHFIDPDVAFVGTPQVYGNTRQSWIARGAAEQTYMFYGPLMRGLSSRSMTLLIGANHIIRVAALEEIGHYVGHLTEDLATGMTLHSRRWKSVYVAEALAIGEGPTTWKAYFNQQMRWAFGCLDIYFRLAPRLLRTMRLRTALYYLLMQQFYFSGVTIIVGCSLLVLYFCTGWQSASIQLEELLLWYTPVLVVRQVMVLWSQRFNVRPRLERGMLWAGRLITITALPIYFLALVGVLRGRRLTFKVTPKGEGTYRGEPIGVFLPHLTIAGLLSAGMVIGCLLGHTAWPLLAWAFTTAVLLSAFAMPAAVGGVRNVVHGLKAGADAVPAPSTPLFVEETTQIPWIRPAEVLSGVGAGRAEAVVRSFVPPFEPARNAAGNLTSMDVRRPAIRS